MNLSIIIPLYNKERYINRCLDSIYSQDVDECLFEIIVVNDGSIDNSVAIAEEFEMDHENLRIIHQENKGLSAARNYGLKFAKNDYVWFVDGDDMLPPNALETVFTYVNKEKDLDVLSSPLLWTYDDKKKNKLDINIDSNTYITCKEYLSSGFSVGCVGRFITKKRLIKEKKIYFPEGIIHEDAVWGMEILYVANNVLLLSKPYYNYCQDDEESIMHTISIKSAYSLWEGHRLLSNFCNEDVTEKDKKWFREDLLGLFVSMYSFIRPISNSSEYAIFKAEFKEYKNRECWRCFKNGSLKIKLKSLLLITTPFFIHDFSYIWKNFLRYYTR